MSSGEAGRLRELMERHPLPWREGWLGGVCGSSVVLDATGRQVYLHEIVAMPAALPSLLAVVEASEALIAQIGTYEHDPVDGPLVVTLAEALRAARKEMGL